MRRPLFPLNLVLFPGQTLPLHIFEERYKKLLQRCLSEQIPFGMLLVKENSRAGRGTPHSIGTFAVVTSADEVEEGRCVIPAPHKGGCYHIICQGDERFRVGTLDRSEAEYLVGEVELYPDEPAPEPALAMVGERVSSLFDDYYRHRIALMGGWQRETAPGETTVLFDISALLKGQNRIDSAVPGDKGARTIRAPSLPADPTALSHSVASELNITPEAKQELLELPSALARLQREAEILAEETPQLEERLKLQNERHYRAFGVSS